MEKSCTKSFIFICLAITLFLSKGYGQTIDTLQVKYSTTINPKKNNKKKQQNTRYRNIIDKIYERLEKQIFVLNIKNSTALFFKEEKMEAGNSVYQKIAKRISGFDNFVYTDLDNGIQRSQDEISGQLFLFEREPYKFQWQLIDSTKTIHGLTVKKAKAKTTDKDGKETEVITWYCPEIPVQFGPGKFGGLPGLITNIKYGIWELTLKNIDYHPKNFEIQKPTKGKKVSDEEFSKIKKNILRRYDN